MDLIYVETTVIGNVAGRIHSNPDVVSRQRATRAWWDSTASQYELAQSEPRDALHIAVAAVQRVQYLVTWNFKHIANATMRSKIEQTCRDNGFEPPIICTPPEIPGDSDD